MIIRELDSLNARIEYDHRMPIETLSREDVAKVACLAIHVFLSSILCDPVTLRVHSILGPDTILIKIESKEIGTILGKNGKTINALRTLMECVAGRHHQRIVIDTVYELLSRSRK